MVACSHCSQKLKAPAEAAGKKAKCPSCGKTFVIAFPADPPEEFLELVPAEGARGTGGRRRFVAVAAVSLVAGAAVALLGVVAFRKGATPPDVGSAMSKPAAVDAAAVRAPVEPAGDTTKAGAVSVATSPTMKVASAVPATVAEAPPSKKKPLTGEEKRARYRELVKRLEAETSNLELLNLKLGEAQRNAIEHVFFEDNRLRGLVNVKVTIDGQIETRVDYSYQDDKSVAAKAEAATAEFNKQLADRKSSVSQRVQALVEDQSQKIKRQRELLARLSWDLERAKWALDIGSSSADENGKLSKEQLKAKYKRLVLDQESVFADMMAIFQGEIAPAVKSVFQETVSWDSRIISVDFDDGMIVPKLIKPKGAVPNEHEKAELERVKTAANEFNQHSGEEPLNHRIESRVKSKKKMEEQGVKLRALHRDVAETRAALKGIDLDGKTWDAWLNDPPHTSPSTTMTEAELDEMRRMSDAELAEKYRLAVQELQSAKTGSNPATPKPTIDKLNHRCDVMKVILEP